MKNSEIVLENKIIVPSIYINIDRDGNFGNNLLFLGRIYKDKKDIEVKEENYEIDLIFTVRENFNDSMIHTFTEKKNTSIITMKEAVTEKYYISIKSFSHGLWEKSRTEQLQELKDLKNSFFGEFLGNSLLVSELSRIEASLKMSFSGIDNGKAYYKKISDPAYMSIVYGKNAK